MSVQRYARQIRIIGDQGQARLAAAHVAIVGVGALGCAIADHLARAGVGTLTLVDRDVVEPTNLQRQCLFAEADVGSPKASAAATRLAAVNSSVRVYAEVADCDADNAERVLGILAQRPAVLVDGTDNFQTRYLLNDLSVKHGIPHVYGGAVAAEGASAVLNTGPDSPCLRCLYPEVPAPGTTATCDSAGVLGPAVALVAALQAVEVIKLVAGFTDRASTSLRRVDLWTNAWQGVSIAGLRDPDCVCCGRRQFEFLEPTRDASAPRGGRGRGRPVVLCGRNAVQLPPTDLGGDDWEGLADRLADRFATGSVRRAGQAVTVSLGDEHDGQPHEITLFADGRVLVTGTSDPERARALAARVLG